MPHQLLVQPRNPPLLDQRLHNHHPLRQWLHSEGWGLRGGLGDCGGEGDGGVVYAGPGGLECLWLALEDTGETGVFAVCHGLGLEFV